MRYRLIKAVTTPISFTVRTLSNGSIRYRRIRLEPGKLYETDDTEMYKSLLEREERVTYSQEKEQALEGADYRKEVCRACGGRVTKLIYHPVEGVTDETD